MHCLIVPHNTGGDVSDNVCVPAIVMLRLYVRTYVRGYCWLHPVACLVYGCRLYAYVYSANGASFTIVAPICWKPPFACLHNANNASRHRYTERDRELLYRSP